MCKRYCVLLGMDCWKFCIEKALLRLVERSYDQLVMPTVSTGWRLWFLGHWPSPRGLHFIIEGKLSAYKPTRDEKSILINFKWLEIWFHLYPWNFSMLKFVLPPCFNRNFKINPFPIPYILKMYFLFIFFCRLECRKLYKISIWQSFLIF